MHVVLIEREQVMQPCTCARGDLCMHLREEPLHRVHRAFETRVRHVHQICPRSAATAAQEEMENNEKQPSPIANSTREIRQAIFAASNPDPLPQTRTHCPTHNRAPSSLQLWICRSPKWRPIATARRRFWRLGALCVRWWRPSSEKMPSEGHGFRV